MATTNMFLKLSNGIKGESADSVYSADGAIDVYSWSWGLTQAATGHTGSGSGGSRANIGDMFITKKVDLASNDLILRAVAGEHFEWAELIVVKPGGIASDAIEYYKIKMFFVIMSSYNTGGPPDADGQMMENLALNFREFSIFYAQQENLGAGGTDSTIHWDIAKNLMVA